MILLNPFDSSYKNWLRDNYSLRVDGVTVNVTEEEKDAYANAAELFLRHESEAKKFDVEQVKDLIIPLDTQCAKYTNPVTGLKETVQLSDIEDPEIQTALVLYFKEAGAENATNGVTIAPYSKGNLRGAAPLDTKGDAALNKLKQSYTLDHAIQTLLPQTLANVPSQVNPVVKNLISRRFLFVEHFYTKMTEMVDAKIAARTQDLARIQNDHRSAQALEEEIKVLKELQEQLKNLDFYALFKVLSIYPVGPVSPQDLEGRANYLREQVSQELLPHVEADWQQNAKWNQRLRDKLPGAQKRELSQIQLAYLEDVVRGLNQTREQDFRHCEKHNLPKKNDGIADLFIRESVKFSMHQTTAPGTEYKAVGFQKSIFLNKMKTALKAEMQGELQDIGIAASRAIDFGLENEYQTAPLEEYKANATDAEKRAVDEGNAAKRTTNVGSLKKDIAAHKERIAKGPPIEAIREAWKQTPDPGVLETPVAMPLQKIATGAGDLLQKYTPGFVQSFAGGLVNVMDALTPAFLSEALGITPSTVVQIAKNIPNMLPNQVALVTAMSAGVSFLQQITPPAVFAEFSKVAPAFLVQAVETSMQSPTACIAVATALGMLATSPYPKNDYEMDGKVKRILNPQQALLLRGVAVGGLALALNYPTAVAEGFTAAVNYLSVPGNLVNLLGWTVVANRGVAYLKDRRIAPLLGVAALGGMLYYGQPMGMIGNVVSASSQVVANAVQTVVYSNPVTGTMGGIVAGTVRAFAPVVIAGVVAPGVKLYSRLLPQSIGSVLDKGVTQFSTNVQKSKAGQLLGSAANKAVGLSTALVTKTMTTAFALFFFLQYFYTFLRRTA